MISLPPISPSPIERLLALVNRLSQRLPRGAWILAAGLLAGASAVGQSTARVSVDSSGNQGNARSIHSAISGDGRFTGFVSEATNMVSGDTNGFADVFVHDSLLGFTEIVSVDSSENLANGSSLLTFGSCLSDCSDLGYCGDPISYPALSQDGRYVAFASYASNLVPGDTNDFVDIFLRDRQLGSTQRVSVSSSGGQSNCDSYYPFISRDGRYVGFTSYGNNLVPSDLNDHADVFLRDLQVSTTELVGLDLTGNQGFYGSRWGCISQDGRYVSYVNVDDGQVLVHDRQTGVVELASADSSGNPADSVSYLPVISGDGRYVAFESLATNLVASDTNGALDVFVRDRQTGTTECLSVDGLGTPGNSDSARASISLDGRNVVFWSYASNLVPGDVNGQADCFLRDRLIGMTYMVNASNSNDGSGGNPFAISDNGRYVAFDSSATNLVANDTNNVDDAFRRDRLWTETFTVYCNAGSSASGCFGRLLPSGVASATYTTGFVVTALTVEGQKDGLFFYGQNGQQMAPWGNGTSFQCVVPPVKRGGLLSGNGTLGACDGVVAQDLNARWCPICPKPSHAPTPGRPLQVQFWYRDPLSTSNQSTSLSNAIEVEVVP